MNSVESSPSASDCYRTSVLVSLLAEPAICVCGVEISLLQDEGTGNGKFPAFLKS